MSEATSQKKLAMIRLPILLIIAVIILLGMLCLGVWQLDRAEQKQSVLTQLKAQAESEPKALIELLEKDWESLRFTPIRTVGQFLSDASMLVDNQVLDHRAGYQVVTPFQLQDSEHVILVSRGWVAQGATRQDLPTVSTPIDTIEIVGRLNRPYAQPPIWNDDYPVNQGRVWQYLPIAQIAAQIQSPVLPLMIELAPDSIASDGMAVRWQAMNNEWVAKHKAYAFQWFAMAIAFFVACLILFLRYLSRQAE